METATLLGVMTKRKPFSQVLKNLFFPNVQYFHSKKIDLDKVKKSCAERHLCPRWLAVKCGGMKVFQP